MRRFTTLVKKGGKFAVGKGQKAFQDSDLLKILRSEINHELTFNQFQDENGDALGNFVIEWDSQQTQDVLLRKKSESGEEVAVSALLGPAGPGDGAFFPREVLMKVCIKKPGLSSFLLFNCQAASQGTGKSGYDIQDAYYIQSVSNLRSAYRGPLF